MNDITDEIESDILIFADDTSLFATGSDPAETAQILNRDLQKNQTGHRNGKLPLILLSLKTLSFQINFLIILHHCY